MNDDQPKVGNIVIVDTDTIARVMKTEPDKIIIHALDFPFFRSVSSDNYDVTTLLIAENTRKAITQLMLPTMARDWSIAAWEKEVDDIVDYILDDLDEDWEDQTLTKKLYIYLASKAKRYCRESEWVSEPDGQEKCVKYSVNYLEVTAEQILEECPAKEHHLWTSIRKASAIVHLSRDVYDKVRETLEEEEDDYDPDDDNFD